MEHITLSGDWGGGICPQCTKDALGDSHDWPMVMWDLWNMHLHDEIRDENTSISQILQWTKNINDKTTFTIEELEKIRKILIMHYSEPEYISIIEAAKKELGED